VIGSRGSAVAAVGRTVSAVARGPDSRRRSRGDRNAVRTCPRPLRPSRAPGRGPPPAADIDGGCPGPRAAAAPAGVSTRTSMDWS